MQESPRIILLPAPSQQSHRAGVRAVQGDSESATEAARARRQAQVSAQAFLTLIDSRREDAVEIKGKQFRFHPYGSRGTADGAREADVPREAGATGTLDGQPEADTISADILDGFGAHARNSSAFIASLIAQEQLRQGLYNPRFEAASDAYRRAGGSPSAIDDVPRVFSVAV
jgi:hypothetical protein